MIWNMIDNNQNSWIADMPDMFVRFTAETDGRYCFGAAYLCPPNQEETLVSGIRSVGNIKRAKQLAVNSFRGWADEVVSMAGR